MFSGFCAEMRVFLEGNLAPKCVHQKQDFGLEATLGSSQRSEYWGSLVVFSHE
jgi:hypothetical protein